jgi:hypothetical protein
MRGLGLGLSLGSSIPPPVVPASLSVDFTAAPLGVMTNATIVGTYGLSFARASAATVQTSASALDTTPTTDQPRIGSTGVSWGRGLVIEETRSSLIQNCRDTTAGGWNAGTATKTTGFSTGPDGTSGTGTRFTGTTIQYADYQTRTTSALGTNGIVMSAWVRGAVGATHNALRLAGSIDVNQEVSIPSTTWLRQVFAFADASPGAGENMFVSDPGIAGVASDVAVDLFMVEGGKFVTESIVTGGATGTRAGERLFLTSAASVITANRLGIAYTFVGKGTPPQYTAIAYLWYIDANNNAWMDTNQKINVKIGGTTVTSASAITWASGDVVDIWIACGAGSNAVVEYRLNGGAEVTLVNTALAGNPSAAGSIDLMCSGTTNQLSCWLQKVTSVQPSWVV